MPDQYVTVKGVFDPKATRTIKLIPGANTGTSDRPCPECKSMTSRHFTHCRHYLYQQQYKEGA